MLHGEVDEAAQLRRQVLAVRIECDDRHVAGVIFGEEMDEAAGTHVLLDAVIGRERDAPPVERRGAEEVGVVGVEIARDRRRHLAAGSPEAPFPRQRGEAGIHVGEAVVPREVRQFARRAVPRQICRRGDADDAARAEVPHDEARLRLRIEADRHVDALLDEVRHPVGGDDIERDLRGGRVERGEERHHDGLEDVGRVDAERAARCRCQSGVAAVGRLDLRQDEGGLVEIGLPRLGQAELAGGAVEEAGAQPLLEGADGLVTIAGDMLSRCAAAAKLPLATTVVKVVMLVMRSITYLRAASHDNAKSPERSDSSRAPALAIAVRAASRLEPECLCSPIPHRKAVGPTIRALSLTYSLGPCRSLGCRKMRYRNFSPRYKGRFTTSAGQQRTFCKVYVPKYSAYFRFTSSLARSCSSGSALSSLIAASGVRPGFSPPSGWNERNPPASLMSCCPSREKTKLMNSRAALGCGAAFITAALPTTSGVPSTG